MLVGFGMRHIIAVDKLIALLYTLPPGSYVAPTVVANLSVHRGEEEHWRQVGCVDLGVGEKVELD